MNFNSAILIALCILSTAFAFDWEGERSFVFSVYEIDGPQPVIFNLNDGESFTGPHVNPPAEGLEYARTFQAVTGNASSMFLITCWTSGDAQHFFIHQFIFEGDDFSVTKNSFSDEYTTCELTGQPLHASYFPEEAYVELLYAKGDMPTDASNAVWTDIYPDMKNPNGSSVCYAIEIAQAWPNHPGDDLLDAVWDGEAFCGLLKDNKNGSLYVDCFEVDMARYPHYIFEAPLQLTQFYNERKANWLQIIQSEEVENDVNPLSLFAINYVHHDNKQIVAWYGPQSNAQNLYAVSLDDPSYQAWKSPDGHMFDINFNVITPDMWQRPLQ